MVLLTEDKISIKAFWQKKGYWATKFTAEFPNKSWTLSGLSYHIRKIEDTDSVERRQGSRTKRTVITRENIESTQELVLSQESQPGIHRSVREITRETYRVN